MESLVANYASSDEEEEEEAQQRQQTLPSPALPTSSSSSASLLFSSLPNPKSSSSSSPSPRFSSLPQPKQQKSGPNIAPLLETQVPNGEDNNGFNPKPSIKTKSSSSLFSSLPQPKTLAPSPEPPAPKRVVQFRPPIIPSAASHPTHDSDDDDDEEEEEKERKRRVESESQLESSSVKSFLSSIPAPRNSSSGVLGGGFLPSASSSSSRRSVIENQAPPPASSSGEDQIQEENQVAESYAGYQSGFDPSAGGYVDYGSYESGGGGGGGGVDQNAVVGDASGYGSYYGDYGNQGDYVEYGQYANSWADGSAAGAPPHTAGFGGGGVVAIPGKRRRNEIPTEIVEVKQDELIKNRPREDQSKLTGVAFGPAYQPASTKGKPSKLHKRKHQIGSLYFDMKQKEMELAERRSKGFLTKAETQAKYGW
ncbi:hypothetical protein Tsubulata_016062 [Turnera subulata]|uniref:Proline-rich protein PRCC n=1 Tax=Turnera subulata TaxID=218843 RepID=A0A9Q0J898_9ROSI|nr:hypothetical protein Tsubulata_016062 [Turnera subulata]